MNVRIFWVRAMKCMYAQTRPQFILSSEGVFGGNGVWTHVNSKGKIPSTENFLRGGSNLRRCGQRAQALPTELFQPPNIVLIFTLRVCYASWMRTYADRLNVQPTLHSLPRKPSPTHTLQWPGCNCVKIKCNTSGAHHAQHVLCCMVQRDSPAIKFDRLYITFISALFYWLKPLSGMPLAKITVCRLTENEHKKRQKVQKRERWNRRTDRAKNNGRNTK